jgi:hypothetical protein
MEDRIGDGDNRGEDPHGREIVAVHRQDHRRDHEENHRRIEVDGQLLPPWQTAMNREDEGDDHGDDDAEITDVRRSRKTDEPRGDLDGPAELTDRPRRGSQRDERAQTALEIARPMAALRARAVASRPASVVWASSQPPTRPPALTAASRKRTPMIGSPTRRIARMVSRSQTAAQIRPGVCCRCVASGPGRAIPMERFALDGDPSTSVTSPVGCAAICTWFTVGQGAVVNH